MNEKGLSIVVLDLSLVSLFLSVLVLERVPTLLPSVPSWGCRCLCRAPSS